MDIQNKIQTHIVNHIQETRNDNDIEDLRKEAIEMILQELQNRIEILEKK